MSQAIILSHDEIRHKIRRIAYQIYETFPDEDTIVIAGIASNGYAFAERIADALERISPLKVLRCKVEMDKKKPLAEIRTSLRPEEYQGKGLVLADDVLHSGTTLVYGVRHFLSVPLKKFKTAVLVDRNHKQFPVKADFKGISLSTSLQEHVEVVFDDTSSSVSLS